MTTKILKGQAWIHGDKLLQEQILMTPTGNSNNTVVLVDNIWEDLQKEGTYKFNTQKTYFYWEYKMTDIADDTVEVTVMFECPRPKSGMFIENGKPIENPVGEYAKYWVAKIKKTFENQEKYGTIQPKEILFPGSDYVDSNGNIIVVPEDSAKREDHGDIMNLLGMF